MFRKPKVRKRLHYYSIEAGACQVRVRKRLHTFVERAAVRGKIVLMAGDMCLQAVYEAAADPAICERLYLEGVRPACRAYYGALSTPPPGPTLLRQDQFPVKATLLSGRAPAPFPACTGG